MTFRMVCAKLSNCFHEKLMLRHPDVVTCLLSRALHVTSPTHALAQLKTFFVFYRSCEPDILLQWHQKAKRTVLGRRSQSDFFGR